MKYIYKRTIDENSIRASTANIKSFNLEKISQLNKQLFSKLKMKTNSKEAQNNG